MLRAPDDAKKPKKGVDLEAQRRDALGALLARDDLGELLPWPPPPLAARTPGGKGGAKQLVVGAAKEPPPGADSPVGGCAGGTAGMPPVRG